MERLLNGCGKKEAEGRGQEMQHCIWKESMTIKFTGFVLQLVLDSQRDRFSGGGVFEYQFKFIISISLSSGI